MAASHANRSLRRAPHAASTTRASATTDALPCATRALDANSADAENHANIITINGGAVLAKLTANFGPDYELVDVSYVNVVLHYVPEERNRVALRWEHRRMRSALGPCPPLFVLQHPRLCIRDVLLPLAEVGPHAWVEGRVVHRARTATPPCGAPTGVRIVVMSDSLTSVDVLADGTAHAPLLADDHFRRL